MTNMIPKRYRLLAYKTEENPKGSLMQVKDVVEWVKSVLDDESEIENNLKEFLKETKP